MYQRVIKRGLDILLCGAAMLIIWPLFLLIAILIKLDSKGPVYFKQKRVGIHKTHFYIYKFRTMRTDTPKDVPTHLLQDPDAFITRMGKFLRKTSLDELPQLINIIKGDLAIIGPRPVVAEELKKYGPNTEKFLSVTPGLTGYWAANGRSCTTYEQRMEMELYYIDNLSFKMDVKVFFKTIEAVIKREGAI